VFALIAFRLTLLFKFILQNPIYYRDRERKVEKSLTARRTLYGLRMGKSTAQTQEKSSVS